MKYLALIVAVLPTLALAQFDPAGACMSLEPELRRYCYAIQLQTQAQCNYIKDAGIKSQCVETVNERDWNCGQIQDPTEYENCRKAALLSQ